MTPSRLTNAVANTFLMCRSSSEVCDGPKDGWAGARPTSI
jgi:hypothetical protein